MFAEGALRDRLGPADRLIETFRYDPADGFVRLQRHLSRLQRSAAALGCLHDAAAVDAALRSLGCGGTALRVRLTLTPAGEVEATAQPFAPLPPTTIWTLRIAETHLDSTNSLLQHKTSRRAIYDAARAEFPAEEAGEVLLCNERGELCEGTITNLFVEHRNGQLLTPPLAGGLLPGVLREEMLQNGRAIEHVLHTDDLRAATTLYVGNSLRGLIRARLAA